MRRRDSSGWLSWAALGVAFVALVVAVKALQSVGQPVGKALGIQSQDTQATVPQLKVAMAHTIEQAANEITQAKTQADRQQILAQLRQTLETTYAGASATAQEVWQPIDETLARLEEQVASGSESITQALHQLVDSLRST